MADRADREMYVEAETVPVAGAEARLRRVWDRYGGVDVLASLAGLFTAMGVLAFLAGLFAAGAGELPFQPNLIEEGTLGELDVAGYVVALAVLFVAFFVGGWAAGRIGRYDGGLNGLGVALWMLLLVVAFAVAGAFFGEEFNAFAGMDAFPNWAAQIDVEDATTIAWVTAAISAAVMFLAAWLGGMLGETYHQRVDAAVADAALDAERV